MKNTMKNTILRTLIIAALLALLSTSIVLVTGLILGWKTSTQFSDGFFYAGAILISIGFLNFMGWRNQPASGLMTSQSAVRMDNDDRFKLWAADNFKGYRLLGILGTSGLLLIGVSGLFLLLGAK